MTEGIGVLYKHFPHPDSMLRIYLQSGRYDEILPEWKGYDASDFFVVVGVTDEITNDYFQTLKEKSDEYVSVLKSRLQMGEQWDIEIKPLFRFDSIRNAERFISLVEQNQDTDERNEFIMNLRLDYENGWESVREIASADFEKSNGFLNLDNMGMWGKENDLRQTIF